MTTVKSEDWCFEHGMSRRSCPCPSCREDRYLEKLRKYTEHYSMSPERMKEILNMPQERTHGYIIRWRTQRAAEIGAWRYLMYGEDDSSDLGHAWVMSLRVASLAVRERNPTAEIVRVRRVEGEDQWVPLTHDEAEDIRLQTSSGAHRFFNDVGDQFHILKRIPAAPRWEIDEEDDNG
jgi:hypothetical protein